jgi:hypothetical protein
MIQDTTKILSTDIRRMNLIANPSMERLGPAAKPDACDRLCCNERVGRNRFIAPFLSCAVLKASFHRSVGR